MPESESEARRVSFSKKPMAHDSSRGGGELERGLSAPAALGLNIIDMVGVGPFVTLPLIVIAMGGPQAILGWMLGAVLSFCDGLTCSELGTAYPEAGGSYVYLRKLYGENGLGRALSFLYAWQLLFSAPLSIASGCIGFSQYLSYFFPRSINSWLNASRIRFGLGKVAAISSGHSTAVTFSSSYIGL